MLVDTIDSDQDSNKTIDRRDAENCWNGCTKLRVFRSYRQICTRADYNGRPSAVCRVKRSCVRSIVALVGHCVRSV